MYTYVFSRKEYWSGLPLPSPVDHILSDISTMTCPSWVAPQAWLGFIELEKAVVLVWLDWLIFCEYGFSVSALWCPLATPTILLGFLLPWAWGISSRLLQQSTAAAPYLGWGVSPYCLRCWPSTWDSSPRPSCTCVATAPLVAPPGHRPRPRVWAAPPSCRPWPRARSRLRSVLLYGLCQSLWLCRSQQTVENSERDRNSRPPDLPLEKSVYRSGSNS